MTKITLSCQHCGKNNQYQITPGELSIKPRSRGRLSHLFESSASSPFGSSQQLQNDVAAVPYGQGQGDWERVTPISKLEPRDIFTSLLDAGVTFTFTTTIIGGVAYAADGPLLAAPVLGFCIAGARYYGLVTFALSLTRAKETWSSVIEALTPEPGSKVKVSIDETTNDGRYFIEDEISPNISLDDLKATAHAMYQSKGEWLISAKRIQSRDISQQQARQIVEELRRLNYAATTRGNVTKLSLRGRSVLRQLLPDTDETPKNGKNNVR